MRHRIGVDRMTWECDYPHSDSTWPNSAELLAHSLEGVPDDEIDKITHLNAMRALQLRPVQHPVAREVHRRRPQGRRRRCRHLDSQHGPRQGHALHGTRARCARWSRRRREVTHDQGRARTSTRQGDSRMAIRVVNVGTGLVGQEALRGLIDHPDTELVGHVVHDPDKAGRDVGELIGYPATGIVSTTDLDQALGCRARRRQLLLDHPRPAQGHAQRLRPHPVGGHRHRHHIGRRADPPDVGATRRARAVERGVPRRATARCSRRASTPGSSATTYPSCSAGAHAASTASGSTRWPSTNPAGRATSWPSSRSGSVCRSTRSCRWCTPMA